MNNNLIIVGAGAYGVLVSEIAEKTGLYNKIAFVDDAKRVAFNGAGVLGTTSQLTELSSDYGNIIVAIGNAKVRLSLLESIEKNTPFNIVSLISADAYVSTSATIGKGSVVEPMAVVHTGCVISKGCFISAGAVVNHYSTCGSCVHVDCNATVEGYVHVPDRTLIRCGDVFTGK